LKLSLETRII